MQSAFNHAMAEMEHDWTGRLADVTAPTLVIHGELDPILPLANGQAISELVADARLQRVARRRPRLPSDAFDEISNPITNLTHH